MALVVACASSAAKADPTQPVEQFTRSLSAFYEALRYCENIAKQPEIIRADIKRIRTYMEGLYPTGVPYWALPEPKKNIQDEETCNYMIHDRMIRYQNARRDYALANPKETVPPGFSYTARTDPSGSGKIIYDFNSKARRVAFE